MNFSTTFVLSVAQQVNVCECVVRNGNDDDDNDDDDGDGDDDDGDDDGGSNRF